MDNSKKTKDLAICENPAIESNNNFNSRKKLCENLLHTNCETSFSPLYFMLTSQSINCIKVHELFYERKSCLGFRWSYHQVWSERERIKNKFVFYIHGRTKAWEMTSPRLLFIPQKAFIPF